MPLVYRLVVLDMRRYLFLAVFLILVGSALAASEINFDEQSEISVIVMLKDKPMKQKMGVAGVEDKKLFLEEKKEMIKGQQEKVLGDLKKSDFSAMSDSGEKFHRFSTLNGFTGKITQEEFEQLKNDPDVAEIYLDQVFHIVLDDSTLLINSTRVNNMVQNYTTNLTGKGQTVCVIDTGIDYNHSALGGGWGNRVIGGYDYYNNDNDSMDDQGHGTHVAGIIGSSNATYHGVAPEVNFVALKACGSDAAGSCDGFDMISSMDWCINNVSFYNITIISMSIGDGEQYNASNCSADFGANSSVNKLIGDAINTAVGLGITVVVASGNNGYSNGISSPACAANATSVGATDKSDSISSVTNTGTILDLLAPGVSIFSTVPTGSCTNCDASGFKSLTGTSMATPHVSGAVALLNQYKKLMTNTTYTSSEIETILKNTGTNKTDSGNGLNFSRINVYAAILSIDNTTPTASYISPTPANNSYIGHYNFATIKINATETVNATLEFNSINYSLSLVDATIYQRNMTNLTSTSHTFKVYLADLANNLAQIETRIFFINNTAPNITSYTPNATTVSVAEGSALFFNHTSTDADNDTLTYSWYLNGTLHVTTSYWNYTPNYTAAGNYTVLLTVSDYFSSVNQSWNLTVNNTNRAPVAYITWPTNGSHVEVGNATLFTTNSTDLDGDNLTHLWNFGDSGTNTSANATHTYTGAALFNVTLIVNDSSLTANYSIAVNVTDTLPPSVTVSAPSSGWYKANFTITTTVTDSGLGVNSSLVKYRVSNSSGNVTAWISLTNVSSIFNATFSITSLADGNYTFAFNATDKGGLSNASVNVTNVGIDDTNPLVLTPTVGTPSSSSASISINATDAVSGINYCSATTSPSSSNPTLSLNSGLYTGTLSLLASTTYTATVICTDNAGNSKSNTSSNFTTEAASTTGGSGSGGSSTTAAATNLLSKSFNYTSMTAGTNYELSFSGVDLPFTLMSFSPAVAKSNVEVKVAETNSPPKTLVEVYKYIQITLTNINDSEISSPVIKFKVNKTWFGETYDYNKVNLYRYESSDWKKLTTTMTSEEANFYNYRAAVPGFSYFGIAAEKKPVAAAPASQSFGTQEAAEIPQPLEEAAPVNTAAVEPSTEKTSQVWLLLLLIPAIIVIALVVYFTKYKKPEIKREPIGQKKGAVMSHLKEEHQAAGKKPEEPREIVPD